MAKGQIAIQNTTMSFVIPKKLKEELAVLATKENRSMGNLICTLIDNYVHICNQPDKLTEYHNLILSINKDDTK